MSFYLTQAGYIGIDIEGMAPSDRVAPACRARPIDVLIKDMLINEMFALNEVDVGALKHLEARLAEGLLDVRTVIRRIETSDWWRPYTGAGRSQFRE